VGEVGRSVPLLARKQRGVVLTSLLSVPQIWPNCRSARLTSQAWHTKTALRTVGRTEATIPCRSSAIAIWVKNIVKHVPTVNLWPKFRQPQRLLDPAYKLGGSLASRC
jgi:hypothetical protein